MKLLDFVRRAPKRMYAAIAVAAAVVMVPAALLAWGPDRQTYTMERPADHVTFNSITNNPNYGDEREFVTIKDVTAGGALTNNATLTPGHEYKVQIYVHNNAHSDLNASGVGIAHDTTVRAALPASVNGSETVDGFVSASNATPGTVYDSAALKSDGKVDLEYVNGSAMLHTNFQQTALPDSVITTGVKVGDQDLSGNWRGCLQYAGAVTFNIKVKEQPKADFTMDKQVRKHSDGTGNWVESYAAQPGETVDYIIRYKNTGQVTQENVIVKDTLPAGMTYVAGSTMLANGSAPNGKSVSDNVTTSGINIGTYAPGASAWVRFSAKVASVDQLPCGPQKLVNKASVETGAGTKEDTADVTTTGKECEQPKDIQVCRLSDNKYPVTIKEDEFDSSKYSKNPKDCANPVPGKVDVCNPATGEIITVDEKDSDKYKPVNSEECKDATPVTRVETPTALPQTGVADSIAKIAGAVSLTAATAYYLASRRQN